MDSRSHTICNPFIPTCHNFGSSCFPLLPIPLPTLAYSAPHPCLFRFPPLGIYNFSAEVLRFYVSNTSPGFSKCQLLDAFSVSESFHRGLVYLLTLLLIIYFSVSLSHPRSTQFLLKLNPPTTVMSFFSDYFGTTIGATFWKILLKQSLIFF